jgi:TRAP-type C4-dicarboxylate transport system substrate-binding protein
VAIAALAAAGTTGCGGGDDGGASPSEAAPRAPEVTLTLGTVDPRGRPASDDVEDFADRVEALSDGRITVEIEWDHGQGQAHQYEHLGEQVRTGALDLALVPAGTWDALGVTSFQALQAPFLVTSEALVEDIATGDLGDRMLAGLDGSGVVGLILLPETLRHPVGFGDPLTSPAQYAGAKIRVPVASNASYGVVRALGAEPVDLNGNAWAAAVATGVVTGTESAFAQRSSLPTLGTFTANVTFYPKVNVLVAGSERFAALDAADQEILREAAAATQEYVLRSNPSDADGAAAYCAAGGGVALATPEEVAAFEAAAAPVLAALEADPETKALMAELRALRAAGTEDAEAITPCERRSG